MWSTILWVAMFVQLGAAFGSTICQLIQGRLLHAMWDMVDDAKGWTPEQAWTVDSSFPRPFEK